MDSKDLRSKPIEQLVDEVQALAAVASQPQVQSVAALAARCTIELSQGVHELSGAVFVAKQQIAERLSELNSQLEMSRAEMATASEQAGKHTEALVRWTRVLVVVTAIYTLITAGLLVATILKAP